METSIENQASPAFCFLSKCQSTVQPQFGIKLISRDRTGIKRMVIPYFSVSRCGVLYGQADLRVQFRNPERTGGGFQPLHSLHPCSIWPFEFLRPLNLLFFPSLSTPSPEKLHSAIGHPYLFPVLVIDLSVCNPRTFLIS